MVVECIDVDALWADDCDTSTENPLHAHQDVKPIGKSRLSRTSESRLLDSHGRCAAGVFCTGCVECTVGNTSDEEVPNFATLSKIVQEYYLNTTTGHPATCVGSALFTDQEKTATDKNLVEGSEAQENAKSSDAGSDSDGSVIRRPHNLRKRRLPNKPLPAKNQQVCECAQCIGAQTPKSTLEMSQSHNSLSASKLEGGATDVKPSMEQETPKTSSATSASTRNHPGMSESVYGKSTAQLIEEKCRMEEELRRRQVLELKLQGEQSVDTPPAHADTVTGTPTLASSKATSVKSKVVLGDQFGLKKRVYMDKGPRRPRGKGDIKCVYPGCSHSYWHYHNMVLHYNNHHT